MLGPLLSRTVSTRLPWVLPAASSPCSALRVLQQQRGQDQDHYQEGPRRRSWGVWGRLTALVGGAAALAGAGGTCEAAQQEQQQQEQLSFRERTFRNYENRIRQMSSPEKVFEYFASVQDGKRLWMTPQDFVHALVPSREPSRVPSTTSGSTEKVSRQQASQAALSPAGRRLFSLVDANRDGLLDFTEYMFLITVLSIPVHQFHVAFRMFDLDGNGTVDRSEFISVIDSMRARNPQARAQVRASDEVVPQSVLERFFGKDGSQALGYKDFLQFVENLHTHVLELEFEMYDEEGAGSISAFQFALALVAQCPPREFPAFVDRAEELRDSQLFKGRRVTFEEFLKFNRVLHQMDDIVMAIDTFTSSAGSISKEDLKRASRAAAGSELSDLQVDVIFYLFAENGELDTKRLGDLLSRRVDFGLSRERTLGFTRTLSCFASCFKDA